MEMPSMHSPSHIPGLNCPEEALTPCLSIAVTKASNLETVAPVKFPKGYVVMSVKTSAKGM